GNRPVGVALPKIREAAVVKGKREFGIKPDRLVVVSNRPVVVTFVHICAAAAEKGGCVSGNESDCLPVVGNRSVIVAVVNRCVALAHQGGVPRPHLAIIFVGRWLRSASCRRVSSGRRGQGIRRLGDGNLLPL